MILWNDGISGVYQSIFDTIFSGTYERFCGILLEKLFVHHMDNQQQETSFIFNPSRIFGSIG